MSDGLKPIREIIFATIYESITSIFKDQLTIEEMEKMIQRLKMYVEYEKKAMSRD